MARGFESKSVADQQEQAERGKPVPALRGDPVRERTRRTLELARVDVQRRLAAAPSEPIRKTLQRALDDLDRQLAALASRGGGQG